MSARLIVGLILSLSVSLAAVPAAAQENDAGFSFDSAVAPTGLQPGVTLTAPFKTTWSHLYAHVGRDTVGPGHDSTTTTQAGIRFIAPRLPDTIPFIHRLQFFSNVGMNHLSGAVGLDSVLAVAVQPGVRVYLHYRWGLEFRTQLWHVREVVKAGNPYSRHSRALVGLFGRW